MKHPHTAALVLAWSALALSTPASTRHMPVTELRPGMVGVGRTAFQGTQIEEFRAHILGVIKANVGPRRDLILARLEGGPLAKTGVIAGMSGSPVYVDGRLIGAVSYALGSFPTEPFAGITPIAEMMEAAAAPAEDWPRPSPISIGSDLAVLMKAVETLVGPDRPWARAPWGLPQSGPPLPDLTSLRPIGLPLTLGGFGGDGTEAVAGPLAGAGFLPVRAAPGATQAPGPAASALRPGDPVGVALITGDLQLGATGTVTEVDGARVYAFGHAMYNLGPASFALTRAYVHAVLPSLSQSMKLASLGEVVGTVQQDRATAVSGVVGPRPRTIGMTVSLRRDGGEARRFAFELGEHPLLTPLLAYTALSGILSDHEHAVGNATYRVRGRIAVPGHEAVEIDDVHAGEQPGAAAAAAVAMPLASLLTNTRERIRAEAITVEIESADRLRTAAIDRVWLGTANPQRGRTVPVKILFTPWRGEPFVRTVDVEIPRHAEGPLTLVVADGNSLAQWERREQRGTLSPATAGEIIKLLNESRRGNRLYLRLAGRDEGAIVNGEVMPSLPSSVLSVIQGDRGAASGQTVQTSILGAWEVVTDEALSGIRTITIPLPPAIRVP